MGSGSSIPTQIDRQTFSAFVGENIDTRLFDCYCDDNGLITDEIFRKIMNQTDVFLSHNWGNDTQGRNNHDRVGKINGLLQSKGFLTWFDAEQMSGDVNDKMCNGIDNTRVVLVFVTKSYIAKVGGDNGQDNCKLEFSYSFRRKGPQNIIPVVMEPECRVTREWTGPVGLQLGSMLNIDCSSDERLVASVNELAAAIRKIIGKTLKEGGGALTNGRYVEVIAESDTQLDADSVHLSAVTGDQIGSLFLSIDLPILTASFEDNMFSGHDMVLCNSVEDVVNDLKVADRAKAKKLWSFISQWKANGVPRKLLDAKSPSHAPAAAAVVPPKSKPAKSTAAAKIAWSELDFKNPPVKPFASGPIGGLAVDPATSFLYVGSYEGQGIHVYDMDQRQAVAFWDSPELRDVRVILIAQSTMVVSARTGILTLNLNGDTSQWSMLCEVEYGGVGCMIECGGRVYAGDYNTGTVTVLDLHLRKKVGSFKVDNYVNNLALLDSCLYISAEDCDSNATTTVVDLNSHQVTATLTGGGSSSIIVGNSLFLTAYSVTAFDVKDRAHPKPMQSPFGGNDYGAGKIALHSDYIFIGCGGSIDVWSTKFSKLGTLPQMSYEEVTALAVAGNLLYCGKRSGELYIFTLPW